MSNDETPLPVQPIHVDPIGYTIESRGEFGINIYPPYRSALIGLHHFSHVIVTWHADQGDIVANHDPLVIREAPYPGSPETTGVFATRSPNRPNRICQTVCSLTTVDADAGNVGLGWIDAFANTAVLDLKPYFPASDRVRDVTMPPWFAKWPQNLEESVTFDWSIAFT